MAITDDSFDIYLIIAYVQVENYFMHFNLLQLWLYGIIYIIWTTNAFK